MTRGAPVRGPPHGSDEGLTGRSRRMRTGAPAIWIGKRPRAVKAATPVGSRPYPMFSITLSLLATCYNARSSSISASRRRSKSNRTWSARGASTIWSKSHVDVASPTSTSSTTVSAALRATPSNGLVTKTWTEDRSGSGTTTYPIAARELRVGRRGVSVAICRVRGCAQFALRCLSFRQTGA
jgi:hypothetical protein